MSKAYYKVEWFFLEKLLLRLGFASRWVRVVMNCVTTVTTYSFIINGVVGGNVKPSRGLRQEDPLSPYLFIMIADAFFGLLSKVVLNREIYGAN